MLRRFASYKSVAPIVQTTKVIFKYTVNKTDIGQFSTHTALAMSIARRVNVMEANNVEIHLNDICLGEVAAPVPFEIVLEVLGEAKVLCQK